MKIDKRGAPNIDIISRVEPLFCENEDPQMGAPPPSLPASLSVMICSGGAPNFPLVGCPPLFIYLGFTKEFQKPSKTGSKKSPKMTKRGGHPTERFF